MKATTIEAIVASAPESAVIVDGGETFITVPDDYEVHADELKCLRGVNFYDPDGEFFELKRVDAVEDTEIYENAEGRFLVIRVAATFLYGESRLKVTDNFTIWIPESEGCSIEAGDFEGQTGVTVYTDLDADSLDPVLQRFGI